MQADMMYPTSVRAIKVNSTRWLEVMDANGSKVSLFFQSADAAEDFALSVVVAIAEAEDNDDVT